jgi:hypothetical protein
MFGRVFDWCEEWHLTCPRPHHLSWWWRPYKDLAALPPFLDAKESYCIGDFDCQFRLMIGFAILIALDSQDPKVVEIDGFFFAAVDAQTPRES